MTAAPKLSRRLKKRGGIKTQKQLEKHNRRVLNRYKGLHDRQQWMIVLSDLWKESENKP